MDKTVSIRKFDTEVRLLRTEAAAYASAKGWQIVAEAYPILAVVLCHSRSGREIEFRFTCYGWNSHAPSLSLHHPKNGEALTWAEWPKGGWDVQSSHPLTDKPFLCLPGIREYHNHRSHLGDSWAGYRLRGTYRLGDIVSRVQQRFEDSGG